MSTTTTKARGATTATTAAAALPSLLVKNLDLLACPGCGGVLGVGDGGGTIHCATCQHRFPCDGNIPLLFWPTEWRGKEDVTEIVRAFYEETPFPNYDDVDSPESLRAKAEQGVFARLLNDQIPYGASILEAGCGTGQLSNFLGLRWGRTVFGTDLCVNSLRLAQGFRDQHDVPSVAFLQQNLFRPAFKPESFDVVISNGVLHHTSDPRLGFESILRPLKRGGVIVIGLYNSWGRLTTDFRRWVFRATGDRFLFLDPRMRVRHLNDLRKRTWLMDQYKHPHESKHTIDEVLAWFDRAGVEFLNAIPKATAGSSFSETETLFEPHPRGTALDHRLVELGMLLSGGPEGGFFIMIGRKK
jgi:SAM-dependent methyltransferase